MKEIHQKILNITIPILLILILISTTTYYRLYIFELPITDNWAQQTVDQNYKEQIKQEVTSQFPQLPEDYINKEVEKKFLERKNETDSIKSEVSDQFKSQLQDEKGVTYVSDIDPYLWMGYTKNYLKCGHSGCDLHDDGKYYNYRNGRLGRDDGMPKISMMGVFLYKITGNINTAFNLIPIIIIALSIIPAFFICRKITQNNVGAFFGALFIALSSQILQRAYSPDTDSANVLFPLIILWLFFETMTADKWWKRITYSIIGGISLWIYKGFWSIEHILLILLIVITTISLYHLIRYFIFKKDFMKVLKGWEFFIISLIIVSLDHYDFVLDIFAGIYKFMTIKDVATTTLFPSVYNTVAEFNVMPLKDLPGILGGTIFIIFAVVGVLLMIYKAYKEEKFDDATPYVYVLTLTLFVVATAYSFTKGVRFALLVTPFFAICFGVGIGLLYKYITEWNEKSTHGINKIAMKALIIIMLLIMFLPNMLITADSVSKSQIPYYNDAWKSTFATINSNATDNHGIILSWWDFGHYTVYSDVRSFTDGGFNTDRLIFWTGKAMITNNEKLSVGIMRMLNCHQEDATFEIEKYFSTPTTIELLEQIVQVNRGEAKNILLTKISDENEVEKILEYTHCKPDAIYYSQYFMTDDSNIGKSGVINHFGSWNFTKAEIWNTIYNTKESQEQIITKFKNSYNMTDKQARDEYDKAQNTKADDYISTWMGMIPQRFKCKLENNNTIYNCDNAVRLNLTTLEGNIYIQGGTAPIGRLAFFNANQEITVKEGNNNSTLGVILTSDGQALIMDSKLVDSIMVRIMFFGGQGLQRFTHLSTITQITGERIIVYKVDIGEY